MLFRLITRSRLLLFAGLTLLILNTYGLFAVPAVKGESGISGYAHHVTDAETLLTLLEDKSLNRGLEHTTDLIFKTIQHSEYRSVQIYENWLFWLMGRFSDSFIRTQNPRRLAAGQHALCGEVAILLNSIMEAGNHNTRLVYLGGHVVSEVETRTGWQIADPDYGVTYKADLKTLEGPRGPEIMREALSAAGYGEKKIDNYVSIFKSAADNIYAETSRYLNPRINILEVITDYLKWIIPLIFLAFSVPFKKVVKRYKNKTK